MRLVRIEGIARNREQQPELHSGLRFTVLRPQFTELHTSHLTCGARVHKPERTRSGKLKIAQTMASSDLGIRPAAVRAN
jgi:hypothetical protein